ncbi:MAG: citrate synthase [Candidatus Omnitrophica bacterium]|nr:citrate synthase [Candidatus Omnitrophota bacterium]
MSDIGTPISKAQNFSKGLEGIVAAQTGLSLVDGERSELYYLGIPIQELIAHSTFEEVVYLLFFRRLPTRRELDSFSKELASLRTLPNELLNFLAESPRSAHPMATLRTAVSALALFDPQADANSREANLQKAKRLVAVMPTIIAAFHRVRLQQKIIHPKKVLSHAENFLLMLHGKQPSPKHARSLDQYLIMLADHGLNASTFAARVTIATQSDIYSAVTSAIGTLKGDLHGLANQRAMEMFMQVGSPEKAADYVKELFREKKKVMGFGHRIYKKEDPRAPQFREIAESLCKGTENEKWLKVSQAIEKAVRAEKPIPPNVDYYSSIVLYALGIPVDFFTTIFAMSRVTGWAAHIFEQLEDNRLIRPEADYTGPMHQPYIPISQRKS